MDSMCALSGPHPSLGPSKNFYYIIAPHVKKMNFLKLNFSRNIQNVFLKFLLQINILIVIVIVFKY